MSEDSNNKTQNKTKAALKEGRAVLGTIITTSTPPIVEALGWAGLDFVMIDAEHAPLDAESIENLIRAADVCGLTALVRVRDNDSALILRSLDVGAAGVHIPGVSTAEETERAVRATKYWPGGSRGLSPSHRAARYGQSPLPEYMASANEKTMVVVHIEDQEGVDNIDEILDVSGLDVTFIGTVDMSQSFGVPGQTDHPLVQEAVAKILDAASKKGLAVGTACGNVEAALKLKNQGFRYILMSTALRLLGAVTKDAQTRFNGCN